MKRNKLVLLLGVLLSLFAFAACSNAAGGGSSGGGSGGGSKGPFKVTFNDNDTIVRTVEIAYGQTISASQQPSNPSKLFNYFLYWSESKASQKTAVEFDFTKPIKKDTVLYAIYTPKLVSTNAITDLTPTQIQIQLYDINVFPLDDGSYAGLKFQHSTDGSNFVDFPLSIPSSCYDVPYGSYGDRYLTYTFPSPLPGGTNYIKVSNGHESDTKDVFALVNPKTVTFDDCGSIKTVEIEAGTTLAASQKPSDPYKQYNYFMYWSASKASLTAATAFDFENTPITDNITLYAIYTPELYSIEDFSATQIEIKLDDTSVFPLDDGSYAGIHISYSSDGNDDFEANNFQDIDNCKFEGYSDTGYTRYLTYSFPDTFSLAAVEKHTFKVTNNHNTEYKSKTLTEPKTAKDLKVKETADSYAKISFTSDCDGWSYKVTASKNDIEVASKSILIKSKNATSSVEFFGLQNGTEYTFKVITEGSNPVCSAEITATPSIPAEKKSSDWLVLMYMDGDNNLHNAIYLDLNEAENGLSQIRWSDGSPSSSYDSVNVVTLWDGATSWEDTDDNGNPVTETPVIGKNESGSYIFELGTDSFNTSYISSSAYTISNNTKNLSYTADWLCPDRTESTNQKQYHGEVNMGDKQTLINFLNWAKAHYTATKGIILQFSNHGGGPRSVMYAEADNGRTYKIGDNSGRRALCWDDSSGNNAFLKTKDVSDALTSTGFTGTNKLSMILMDVCLGSSLEDAYQFRNNADYLAASPNTIPGSGLDYKALMKAFSKNATIDDIGKQIVLDYKNQYTAYDIRGNLWDSYAATAFGKTYSNLNADEKSILEWFGDLGITTFTITDLSKVENIKAKVDALCNILLSNKNKTIYVDNNGNFSPTATGKTENYVKYLGKQHADIISQNYVNNSIYYQGSYTWLYDIGYFADRVLLTSTSNLTVGGVSTTNVNEWPELYSAAADLITALGGNDRAIRYSWRDSKLSSTNYDFYNTIDGNEQYQHPFGLTIAGYGLAVNAGQLVKGTVPNWYKTDLAFGADSQWGELLEYWFNN